MNTIKKYFSKKNIIIISLFTLCLTISFSFCYSYFITKGTFAATKNIRAAAFGPRVNSSIDRSQNISLASTITNNKALVPGAEGKFNIKVDLSSTDLNTYYKLYYDNTDIPNNLHFYVDEGYTTEFSKFEGVQHDEYITGTNNHYIYWKWDYVDSEEANSNDSLYMNREIVVPFKVDVSQHLDNRTIIVNNIEKQTGDILIDGDINSFNLNLNFENLNPTNYKIFLDNSDVSSHVHFYSDSAYTNEITNISGYYDGTNNEVTKTIYWKTDDSRSVVGTVYYAVYLP